MSDFFHGGGPFGSFDLTWMGAVSPAIVKLIYPMDAIAQWHHQMHIPGVTSHWMDAARFTDFCMDIILWKMVFVF